MGTTIRIFAEKRTASGWSLCEPLTTERNRVLHVEPEDPLERPLEPQGFFHDQNYSLFGVLADVRNDMFWRPKMVPISMPRGLPPDLSPELAAWANWFGETDDPSWLLLRELEEFPWDTMTCQCVAMVKPELAVLFGDPSLPFPLSRWPSDEPRLYAGHIERDGVKVEWTATYAEQIGTWFVVDVVNRLRSYGPSDEVRVVFWFSS
jgi:hypothetical protein